MKNQQTNFKPKPVFKYAFLILFILLLNVTTVVLFEAWRKRSRDCLIDVRNGIIQIEGRAYTPERLLTLLKSNNYEISDYKFNKFRIKFSRGSMASDFFIVTNILGESGVNEFAISHEEEGSFEPTVKLDSEIFNSSHQVGGGIDSEKYRDEKIVLKSPTNGNVECVWIRIAAGIDFLSRKYGDASQLIGASQMNNCDVLFIISNKNVNMKELISVIKNLKSNKNYDIVIHEGS